MLSAAQVKSRSVLHDCHVTHGQVWWVYFFLSKSNNGSKVWKILVGGIPVQSRRLNYIYMSVKQFSCKGQK